MDSSRLDDEHKLIAMYAQRLSQEAKTVVSTRNIDLGFVSAPAVYDLIAVGGASQ